MRRVSSLPGTAFIGHERAEEELEHKAVTYDVYEIVGNSRTERAAAALASMLVLLPVMIPIRELMPPLLKRI